MVKFKCFECKCSFEEPESGIMITRKVKGEDQWFCSISCKIKKKPKHKFNAIRCESDSIKFSSRKERSYYTKLKSLVKSGEVLFFLRQTPIHLPGNTKYVVDFQVFNADGTVDFIDVKGYSTGEFLLKKKQVEALYPIEIEVVK